MADVRALLDRGAGVNARDMAHETLQPSALAVATGDLEVPIGVVALAQCYKAVMPVGTARSLMRHLRSQMHLEVCASSATKQQC